MQRRLHNGYHHQHRPNDFFTGPKAIEQAGHHER